MEKKALTNATGEVRELTSKDIRSMRTAKEVLPAGFLKVLLRSRGNAAIRRRPQLKYNFVKISKGDNGVVLFEGE